MSNETNLTSFRQSCLWGAVVAVDLTIAALLFLTVAVVVVVVVVGILCPVINMRAKRARKSFVRRTSGGGHCEALRDDDDIG